MAFQARKQAFFRLVTFLTLSIFTLLRGPSAPAQDKSPIGKLGSQEAKKPGSRGVGKSRSRKVKESESQGDYKAAYHRIQKGDYSGAEKILESLPFTAERFYLFARIQVIHGKYSDAILVLKKGLEKDPHHPGCLSLLVQVYLDTGQYGEAQKLVKVQAQAKPDRDSLEVIQKALVAYETGDLPIFEGLIPALQQISRQYQSLSSLEATDLARALYEAYERTGDLDVLNQVMHLQSRAPLSGPYLDLIDYATQKDPFALDPYLLCTQIALEKENHPIARDCLKKAAAVNPADPDVLLFQLQLPPQQQPGSPPPNPALVLAQLLQTNPNFLDVYLQQIGNVLQKGEDLSQAWRLLAQAKKINPRNSEVLADEGMLYLYRAQENKFKEYADGVAKRENSFRLARLYGLIGNLLTQRARWYEGQKYFERALHLDPKLWEIQTKYALNLIRMGKTKEGKTILEENFKKDPFNLEVYNVLKFLDKLDTKFVMVQTKHFHFFLHHKESELSDDILLAPYLRVYAEKTFLALRRRYKIKIKTPITVILLTDPDDLSVLTFGRPILGVLGSCFGEFITNLTPEAQEEYQPFNWAAVFRHELSHAYHLTLSHFMVPRWFTEGLAVHEESQGNPHWFRSRMDALYAAYRSHRLPTLEQLATGRFQVTDIVLQYYEFGELVMEYIDKTYGWESILKLLKLWGRGLPSMEVLQQGLGKSLPEIQKGLDAFLKKRFAPIKLFLAPSPQSLQGLQQQVQAGLHALPGPNPNTSGRPPSRRAHLLALLAFGPLGQKNYEEAKKEALQAIEADPKEPLGYYVLGLTYRGLEQDQAAQEAFQKALDRGFDYFQTYFYLAQLQEKRGETEEAVLNYLKAIEKFPYTHSPLKESNPYLAAAALLDQEGLEARKIQVLERYAAMDNTSFPTFLELAQDYFKRNNLKKAQYYAYQALYVDTRSVLLHQLLARLWIRLKQWPKAAMELSLLDQLLGQVGDSTEATTMGKFDKQRAIIKCKAARIYAHLNERKKAAQLESQALQLDPSVGTCSR